MFVEVLMLIIGVAFVLWYLLWTRNYGKYRANGITEDPATFPLGSKIAWNALTGRNHFQDMSDYIFKEYPDDKFVVSWFMNDPVTIVKDIDLAKLILVKDFDHFVNRRRIDLDKEANKYFLNSLIALEGDEWKYFRSILSPIFTSGKLKNMTPFMDSVGDKLVEHISTKLDTSINNRDLNIRYMTDVVSSCVFGFEAGCFDSTDAENVFYDFALTFTRRTNALDFFLILFLPKLAKLMKISFFPKESSKFLVDCLQKTLRERKTDSIHRNDLTGILIRELEDNPGYQKLSNEEYELVLMSNAYLFFLAGFSTSSLGISTIAHYLAKHQVVQQRLFDEILEAVEDNGGNQHLDYTKIQSLQYLDMVVNESLRLFSPGPLERVCLKDYQIPGSNHIIKKGEVVSVPSRFIMRSEEYFKNPNVFDPDRFHPDTKNEQNSFAFLAFGQGPRNCIAVRFARLILKTNIMRVLYNFKILPCEQTIDGDLVPDPRSQEGAPKGGFWVKYQQRC